MEEETMRKARIMAAGHILDIGFSAGGIEIIKLPREAGRFYGPGSALNENAVCQVRLENASSASENEERHLLVLVEFLRSVFEGREPVWTPMVALRGIDGFALNVLKATSRIPWGETRSYAWVAGQAGVKGAARAAGNALGGNPVPIVIPCHRVIHSDGTMGGYSSGPFWKGRLLSLESGSAARSCV